MLKKILIGLAAVIVVFVIVVATRPSEFRVTRSATVAATPEAVFTQVNNLRKWNDWSPWAKLDPNAKNTFSGPESGQDAEFHWAGNSEVGEGKMTITESRAPGLVRFHLVFYQPMAAESDTEFTFKADGTNTTVTWMMTGKNDFIGRAVCLFMNMDQELGRQFEQGLANLKAIVEAPAKP